MDRFAICQAFEQLESDFNVGGWVRERPSNQRRRESIGCQLARIKYHNPHGWVDIEAEPQEGDDPMDEEVREIYLRHALIWGLPLDADLKAAAQRIFTPEFLAGFDQMATSHTWKRLPPGVAPNTPVNSAGSYYAPDGTFMNADGTRSIFDDIES